MLTGTIRTTEADKLYKCVLPQVFRSEMKYCNTGYEGFYLWMSRDLSAPTYATTLELLSAGSNCDKYTTWYYTNAVKESLRSGSCIKIGR